VTAINLFSHQVHLSLGMIFYSYTNCMSLAAFLFQARRFIASMDTSTKKDFGAFFKGLNPLGMQSMYLSIFDNFMQY
jgi:hypothetical protein